MLKRISTLAVVTLAVALGVSPGQSKAQILTAARCQNAYNVTAAQAQGRMGWGVYCRTHPTNNPATGLPFPGTKYLTDASVLDYNARPDLQPWLFPTYFDFVTFAVWDIPFTAGTDCTVMPAPATNVGLCVAGCYKPDQVVRFVQGDVAIKDAADGAQVEIITLTGEATFDDLSFMTNRVARYVVDRDESLQDIFMFTMESGGTLKVTSTHPLVTSDGRMRQAVDLRVGDELVLASGESDPIVDVKVEEYFGKVYNVAPETLDHMSNIVVAQGYLNGSHRYQNEFLDTINSVVLRRSLEQFPE